MGKLAIKLVFFLFLGIFLMEGRAASGEGELELSDVELGAVAVGGPGCPAGSVRVSLGGEEGEYELNLIYDEFYISAETAGRALKRLSCSVALPLKVATGKAIVIERSDLWALLFIEDGDRTKITTETFLAGQVGERLEQEFTDEVYGFHFLSHEGKIKSACGADSILRNNSSLLQKSAQGLDSFSMIDGLQVRFKIVDC